MNTSYKPFAMLPEHSSVMVAFSGGVDSAVSAYLCKQAGFQVRAVIMSLLGPENFDVSKARQTADLLGIPLDILELSPDFEKQVMRQTWEIYAAGRTPNPCAVCNPVFKFGRLEEYAKQCGCAALVTGHYARQIGGQLYKGVCQEKDQSYFLFGLSREQLACACFPLGALQKSEVRDIAQSAGLPCSQSKESQDACFAPQDGSNMAEMLRCRFGEQPQCGNFISTTGQVLGQHTGIHTYTIGQRKGTGVAMGVPAYVKSINASDRTVTLTTDPADLMSTQITLDPANLLDPSYDDKTEWDCMVKIRYRSKPAAAHIQKMQDCCLVTFQQPQRAVTPGQAAVFYDEDHLLGGAWIRSADIV